MGPGSSVVRNAGRRRPSASEAEPQLHASIFDEVVPLGPRADAGASIYDERHCIQNAGQQMIARDGRRELRSGAVALFQPQTAAQAKEVHQNFIISECILDNSTRLRRQRYPAKAYPRPNNCLTSSYFGFLLYRWFSSNLINSAPGPLLSTSVWGTASARPYLLLSAGQYKKEFLKGRHIASDFLREEKWQLETIA